LHSTTEIIEAKSRQRFGAGEPGRCAGARNFDGAQSSHDDAGRRDLQWMINVTPKETYMHAIQKVFLDAGRLLRQ
jgi:hypothetical protein